MKRLPLLFSLLAVIALSASLAYWILQLYKPEQRPLAAAPVASMPEPSTDAAATLFGGQALAAVATTYQLTGVLYAGRDSVAILVAEGQPPHALPLGKEIAPGVTVKEVHPRYVMLSEGGVLKRIELATDTKAGDSLSPPPNQGAQPAPNEMTGGRQPMRALPSEPPPPPPPPASVQMPPPVRMNPQPPTQAPMQPPTQ